MIADEKAARRTRIDEKRIDGKRMKKPKPKKPRKKVKNSITSTLFFLALATSLSAQREDQASIAYAESFRHSSTQLTEESFEIKLNLNNPTYRELIKDTHGADRYVFTVTPQFVEGDNKIVSWQAKLVDLRFANYGNILMISPEPSEEAQNNLWRFGPSISDGIPADAKRIIKVDAFYATMQIRARHFTPLDSPYLDSMTVQIDFKNTDPRKPSP
jgi:hypothetical protein